MLSSEKIRKLKDTKEDYSAYTNLISQLASQYKIYDYEVFREFVKELDNDHSSLIFLYEIDNKIVGTIKIIIEKKFYNEKCYVGHIEDVVVDNIYRGQGHGKKMVKFANDLCTEKGCYKVLLYCSDHNVKFYEKSGFMIEGNNLCKRISH